MDEIKPVAAETQKIERKDFIREIVEEDLRTGKHKKIITRFPPEPNGYLHIGHAKAICINFGIASDYSGRCNLRLDDTNPEKEDHEYIDAIIRDIRWLGFEWGDHLYYASDYYQQLFDWALELIKKGLAYVDHLSAEEIREHRGTLKAPGRESPYRNRSVEENLDLFERMRKGEFEEGVCVLRARIDMAASNINLRDPSLYRIKKASHPRTGDKWCIYPMYDFAHGQSDAIEGITHSCCSLEFEDHRPLYEWFLEHLSVPHKPRQIEFARLNLTHTMMSKRKLLELVKTGTVRGWDDPRMPTLCGLRRKGYTSSAIRSFCDRIGVAKANSVVDYSLLEYFIREELNRGAKRVMAVLRPLKVVLLNWPEDKVEEVTAENNPEDPSAGTRKVPFSRELYIEQDDFREDPPKKFFRLSPGSEIRLKHAYYIRCEKVIKDTSGAVTELHCTYDPESRGGTTPDGRKVKGTSHWVSARHAVRAEVRLYEHLFSVPNPGENGVDCREELNPQSLEILDNCMVEPALPGAEPGSRFQFMRQGYFIADTEDSKPGKPVFNRIVGLKDSWAKEEKK
ncbi:MAG: glutamine--tRNA ligase/YqeY domain fusion protein [Candidatus Wallbacteria bacterium]|nr:glutamine--tRNA ligase/YqeY domain fusion protein [Candidatus Wallbacteria bacterium]